MQEKRRKIVGRCVELKGFAQKVKSDIGQRTIVDVITVYYKFP